MENSNPSIVVSLTRLKLTSLRELWPFLKLSNACIKQAQDDINCLAGATYLGPGLTFWTATVWENEEGAREYMKTGAHKIAMPLLPDLCSEAAIGHYTTTVRVAPTRVEIVERIRSNPRFTQLKKPTADHLAGLISDRAPWIMSPFKGKV